MKIIKSKIVPIQRDDIDTDLIIPAEFLTTTTRDGLGKHLFDRLRKTEENFPLNLEKYQGVEIMLVGKNFGCGSSREHAAWALSDWGIKVVIAESFADIFCSNAMKNKILPVVLPEVIVKKIFAEEKKGEYEIEVDLERQAVMLPDGKVIQFALDQYRKECLIKEIDDMDYLLENLSEIKEFDRRHSKYIFFDTSVL